MKTPERQYWLRFGVSIANFEYMLQLALVFLLLTVNMQFPLGFHLGFRQIFSSNFFCRFGK